VLVVYLLVSPLHVSRLVVCGGYKRACAVQCRLKWMCEGMFEVEVEWFQNSMSAVAKSGALSKGG
jgi:hypothetical protein